MANKYGKRPFIIGLLVCDERTEQGSNSSPAKNYFVVLGKLAARARERVIERARARAEKSQRQAELAETMSKICLPYKLNNVLDTQRTRP